MIHGAENRPLQCKIAEPLKNSQKPLLKKCPEKDIIVRVIGFIAHVMQLIQAHKARDDARCLRDYSSG